VYLGASPEERRRLLDLARGGVLSAHLLPRPNNGADHRLFPFALLNRPLDDWEPLRPEPIGGLDPALDAEQREAIARALQSPDVCLIQGVPGAGKSRVAAETAAQAAVRGGRVLLLAPTAAGVDAVLARLAGREDLLTIRCVGPGADAAAVSPAARRLTVGERLRVHREVTIPATRAEADAAARRCDERRREAAVWARLADLGAESERLAGQVRALRDRKARLEQNVAADAASPFQQALAVHRATRDEALAHCDARLAELRAEAAKLRAERQADGDEERRLQPLEAARKSGRWWTPGWWRAAATRDVDARLAALRGRSAERADAETRLEQEAVVRAAARADVVARAAEVEARLLSEECARRAAALDDQIAALEAEDRLLVEKWEVERRTLSPDPAPPTERTTAAAAAGRKAAADALALEERRRDEALRWAAAVESEAATLPTRLRDGADVVAAVLSALPGDPHFGDAASFDLLILEEAHEVAESDFLAAARHARRWVLIGEPADDADPPPPHRNGPTRVSRPGAQRPGFFQRLWRRLHADPRRLPYSWSLHDGRLVCRLRPIPPDQLPWVETERVADRPDVELRIVAAPRTAPQLVEVVFPGATPLASAKEFIFRELGELAVQTTGPAFRWVDEPDRLALQFAPASDADGPTVDLTPGVRERLGRVAGAGGVEWQTCALEFDRQAEWTRDRAEEWAVEHFKLRPLGRTAPLTTPRRCGPPLARFLADLLGASAAVAPVGANGSARPAVLFVAAPAASGGQARRPGDREGRGRRGGAAAVATRPRPPSQGGAGLEIDLTDVRRAETIHADVRKCLPSRGLVNLYEARVAVLVAEDLVADPAFRCDGAKGDCPPVGVVALYPAQAELIRQLVKRSARLSGVAVAVGTPADFRHREFRAAVVSLTRSHTHRAVVFGDGPDALAAALSRARDHIVLIGDPGTLARRSQWQGPVDHLDEAAAERERGLLGRLVAYVQGRGGHPDVFHLHESDGA
jgi:hypothetical protein